jgi:hypothetical protein
MEGKIVMVAAVMEVAVTTEEDNLTLGLGISSISYWKYDNFDVLL